MSCSSNSDIKIMTFCPTFDEFKDFNKYIEYIESQGANMAGICKIIPPREWCPRRGGYESVMNMVIDTPIRQVVHGQGGCYSQINECYKKVTVERYREMANSPRYRTPDHEDWAHLEKKYWSNITLNPAIYGADNSGTVTDPDQPYWNIAHLGTILDEIEKSFGTRIEGVNTPYLYFGMWKTSFPWHTEDMDLYSINYVHYGQPKHWYAVPPAHGRKLERLAQNFFPQSYKQCPAFLRHKTTLISPQVLRKYGVPYDKITQECGEIIITFPFGYHCGFNQGFNIAESTNFASLRWIEYGKKSRPCQCTHDTVKIEMDIFVRKFQTKAQFIAWQEGTDCSEPHPEDAKAYKAAAQEKKRLEELAQNQSLRSTAKEIKSALLTQSTQSTCSSKSVPSGCNSGTSTCRHRGAARHSRTPSDCFAYCRRKAKKRPQQDILDLCESELMQHTTARKRGRPRLRARSAGDSSDLVKATDQVADNSCSKCLAQTPLWAKSEESRIASLWLGERTPQAICSSSVEKQFEMECRFNERVGLYEPHCAICSFFWLPERRAEVLAGSTSPTKQCPQLRCATWLPELIFAKEESFSLEEGCGPGISRVLRCSSCFVTVHARCYGVDETTDFVIENLSEWYCDRCEPSSTNVSDPPTQLVSKFFARCALCLVRGGALKRCYRADIKHGSDALLEEELFCHVTCALAIPKVRFVDVRRRSPILLPRVKKEDGLLLGSCCVCGGQRAPVGGVLAKCSYSKCKTYFHPTCAYFDGVLIEVFDWPWPSWITCKKHRSFYQALAEERRELTDVVRIGDRVTAKHRRNRRWYGATVRAQCGQIHYCVDFTDGSFSDDVPPDCVRNYDWQVQGGHPSVGTFLDVEWTGGQIFRVKFLGLAPSVVYTLEFDNGDKIEVKREEFYSACEKLPAKVMAKLGVSSSQMHTDFFCAGEKEAAAVEQLQRRTVATALRELPQRRAVRNHLVISKKNITQKITPIDLDSDSNRKQSTFRNSEDEVHSSHRTVPSRRAARNLSDDETPSRRRRVPSRRAAQNFSDDDAPSRIRRVSSRRAAQNLSDFEMDDEAPSSRRVPSRRAAQNFSDDEAPSSRRVSSRRAAQNFSDDEDYEMNDKAPSSRRVPSQRAAQNFSDDEAPSSRRVPSRRAAQNFSDDEDYEMNDKAPSSRRVPSRRAAQMTVMHQEKEMDHEESFRRHHLAHRMANRQMLQQQQRKPKTKKTDTEESVMWCGSNQRRAPQIEFTQCSELEVVELHSPHHIQHQ